MTLDPEVCLIGHGAPLRAGDWLPPRELCKNLMMFNRQYLAHLNHRLLGEHDRADAIYTVIEETNQCYRAWDAITDVNSNYLNVFAKRLALKRLIDIMGQDAFNNCELPAYVPVWRFVRIGFPG